MTHTFEREKNIKAATYTGIVCLLMIIVFFFAKWTLPQVPQPNFEEGIEVNLGNSDEGIGDVAPQVPGDAARDQEEMSAAPATASAATQEQVIESDEYEDDDAPVVNRPEKKIAKATPISKPVETTRKPVADAKPATNPVPAPPRPKAVYKGGTSGTGGNNADSYNGVNNQGIAGGRGDQGSANGNPNSDSYKGNAASGSSGVSIKTGLSGRRFTKLPSFTDDFNENARVAVDIRVDKNGNVLSANVNPRGTTTTNGNIRSIATRKALQLKLNPGDDEQSGTILFDFKLRG